MKTRLILFIAIVSLFAAGAVSAQFADQAKYQDHKQSSSLGLQPVKAPFQLLDLSRLSFTHSYSISYFSGGNQSGSLGMLNSTMYYEFSRKLSLALNVGVLHNAGSLLSNGSKEASFLPGFSLDYHPSNSFNFRIDYRTVDSRNPYYSRSGYRP